MRSIADDVIVETFQTTSLVKISKLSRLTVGWVIGEIIAYNHSLCVVYKASDNNDKN